MESHRTVEIIEELEGYDRSVKAGRIMSTLTIGEIVDLAKYAEDAADTIERLRKKLTEAQNGHKVLEGEIRHAQKRFDLLKQENDRLRRPRCIDEPAGDPCKFCGARETTDVCRDGTDHIIRERDAALAEVERLKSQQRDAARFDELNTRYDWGAL